MSDSYVIRDADIWIRNFTGEKKNPYDTEGKRYLKVRLDPETADELKANGWPVNMTNSREDRPDYEPFPFIRVNIKLRPDYFYFNGLKLSSNIYMVTKKNNNLLTAEDIHQLEENYIEKADLKIDLVYYKTYNCWSAVLESGFFTIEPDELYEEYFGRFSEPIGDDEEDNPFV